MGVGTPLTEECLSSLLSLFREKEYYESECKQLKGTLPSNLLYLDTRVSNPVLICIVCLKDVISIQKV